MRTILLLGIATACTALEACQSTVGPELARDDSPAQTDSVVYTLRREDGAWRAYVLATYRNTTAADVAFSRCTSGGALPMFSVRRTGADSMRTLFVDWAWACVGGVPTGSIGPGEEVTVRVSLGSTDQPRMNPPLQREWLIGQMRVELMLCQEPVADSDDCDLLPVAQRQSNAFEVRF